MRKEWAILADAASVRGGLANILGAGIDALGSLRLAEPLENGIIGTPTNAVLVVRLMLQRAELGREHKFEMVIQAEDGKEVQRVEGSFYAAPNPNLPAGWDAGITLPVIPVMFGPVAFGFYSINLFGDGGQHLGSIPFRVSEAAVPQQPAS